MLQQLHILFTSDHEAAEATTLCHKRIQTGYDERWLQPSKAASPVDGEEYASVDWNAVRDHLNCRNEQKLPDLIVVEKIKIHVSETYKAEALISYTTMQ